MLLALIIVSILLDILIIAVLLARKSSEARIGQVLQQLSLLEKGQDRIESSLRDQFAQNREESSRSAKNIREEIAAQQKAALESLHQLVLTTMGEMGTRTIGAVEAMSTQLKALLDTFSNKLTELTQINEQKLEKIRDTVEKKLTLLQEDNSKKLEQMRLTVDEKLHQTLEQRLGESFKLVSERLELVHKGLGEMQSLASGVGDLKKVLSNVKTRGTLGEIQLDNILEQILSPDQYERSVATKKGSAERVDFVIKLPGKDDQAKQVFLPIDSKFPMEDYQRLAEAQESGDAQMASDAGKLLEARIKLEGKSMRDKYLNPPDTTDFAIMFLPIEGLFAEVLRRPGLWEMLQRDYKVIITGPTTITALLNSLQMGFRTLAIQKRSSEVWKLLGAVKTDFGKFGEILEKTQKKLQEASKTIDDATSKSRAIERKLRTVEEIPAGEAIQLLSEEVDAVL